MILIDKFKIHYRVKNRSVPVWILTVSFILLFICPCELAGQSLKVDLFEMRKKTEIYLHEIENGELPLGYMKLGLSRRRSFIDEAYDPIKLIREYDEGTGQFFEFSVPKDYPFIRRERRKRGYIYYSQRYMKIPGMDIDIHSLKERAEYLADRAFYEAWKENILYNLGREREETHKGGMLDIDIPIDLPKQIEWFIGEGEETNLSISGREEITVGGDSRWCSNCPRTEGMPEPQKFPDLDMKQKLSVNLHGTIGEKIKVAINHSSQGSGMQSVNQVRVHYQGFEDDIIKLIEMGDTDMTLRGAQMIRYSGSAKGLFGVKVKGQVGPVDLTLIASKEKGETASGTFSSGGGQSSENVIADYGFVKRQFFYLENPGPDFLNTGTVYPKIDAKDSLEVFIELNPTVEWTGDEPRCYLEAYPDSGNDGIDTTVAAWDSWYRVLTEGEDYQLIQDYYNEDEGIKYMGIYLHRSLPNDKALAVRYINSEGDTIGDYGAGFENYGGDRPPDDHLTYKAELICPQKADFSPTQSDFPSTWNMMMRNIYSLNMSNISKGSLKVTIESVEKIQGSRDIHEETQISYLRIFGLDQYDVTGQKNPDGRVDDRQGVIDYSNGFLMFPWHEPFKTPEPVFRSYLSDSLAAVIDTSLTRNTSIYDDLITSNEPPPHYYDIIIEGSSGQKTIQLNAFNIIEGSEVVRIGGVKFSKGSDYTIDYMSGVVTLKGEALNTLQSDPDAKINIDYQKEPLVGGGKSSLIGIGANYDISPDARLNAAFLYNSSGASRYKPNLGEEPSRNMAADINGSFVFRPSWMTSLVNLLPRVDTDQESQLNVGGEVALSIPNPNTKGSAYVDNMEGIEDSNRLTLVRNVWKPASPPLHSENPNDTLAPVPQDVEFYWYNPATTDEQEDLVTSKKDLNPEIDDRENTRVTSLFLKTINTDGTPEDQWSGIMSGFMGGLDLSNAQYLEIWVNDFTEDPGLRGGTVHIDFGEIDEDYYLPDENLFNDENPYDWTAMENDFGFTGDNQNRIYPTAFDESHYNEEKGIYEWINSRVKNSYHDTEDLNGNNRLDTKNNYYSLKFNLADSAMIDVKRDFNGIEGNTSWRMYRIDLSKAELFGMKPRLDAVEHMRIWVENVDLLQTGGDQHTLELAGLKFVGNKWRYDNLRDLKGGILPAGSAPGMRVKAGTMNNKDNPSLYESPYDVEEEEGIDIREQSLTFEVENFADSTSFQFSKRFYGDGKNFGQYKGIEFYYHLDSKIVTDPADSVEFFLQIAYDSLNYYEIGVPIDYLTPVGWNHVFVNLSDLTNLKIGAPGNFVEGLIEDSRSTGKKYWGRLKGKPTLFKVRRFYVGLRNRTDEVITETRFMLNDITLTDVRKDIDFAARTSFSANLGGGILSLNGNWEKRGPEFRSLQQKRGSGVSRTSLSLSGNSKLEHFIPTGGFNIPVSLRYNSSVSKPKYMTQSDVEIADDSVRDSLESASRSYGFNLKLSRNGSSNFIMKHFFDNLNLGYNYSKKSNYTPISSDTSWSMSGTMNYNLQFGKDRTIDLFNGIKWRYWLTNISINSRASRVTRNSYSESGRRPSTYDCSWSNNMSISYDPFESVKIGYQRSETRDMGVDHDFHGVPIGMLRNFNQSMSLDFRPRSKIPILSEFNPSFQYKAGYSENLSGVRRADDPPGTRNVTSNRSININLDFDIGSYAKDFKGYIEHFDEKKEETKIVKSGEKDEEKSKVDFIILIEEEYLRRDLSTEERRLLFEFDTFLLETDSEIDYLELLPVTRRNSGGRVEKKGESGDEPGKNEEGAGESEKTDKLIIVKKFLGLIGRVSPVNTRLDLTKTTSYQHLYERAAVGYQLGITDYSGALEVAVRKKKFRFH